MGEVKKDILWRVYLVYLVVLFFSFFIIGQVAHIQFVEGDSWKKRSDMQTLDTMKIKLSGEISALMTEAFLRLRCRFLIYTGTHR